jgi:hypothetical protein
LTDPAARRDSAELSDYRALTPVTVPFPHDRTKRDGTVAVALREVELNGSSPRRLRPAQTRGKAPMIRRPC